ncbi:MAG: hypothetical protein ACI9P3_004011 [Bradyrhizobium sp.]
MAPSSSTRSIASVGCDQPAVAIVAAFMREALPQTSDAIRAMAGDLIKTTLSTVGQNFSESPRTRAEIKAYADAMADMFCAYLSSQVRR